MRYLDPVAKAALAEQLRSTGPLPGIYFSQCGEDIVLWHYLNKTWNGFYVDVGAHDPYRFSNTHLLYQFRHWRGINVDFDPRAIEAFDRARPGDINLQVAISDTVGELSATFFKDGAVNTCDADTAETLRSRADFDRIETVRCVTLKSVLDEHAAGQSIDLLAVDAEGLDWRVLRGNDWSRYRPRYVVFERRTLNLDEIQKDPTHVLLRELGYHMIGHTVGSSIYWLRK
jgi:FkbM family methyltransferase